MAAKRKRLTFLQAAFVRELLKDPTSPGAAYHRASPKANKRTCETQAWQYLHEAKYAHVRAEYDRQVAVMDKKAGKSAEDLFKETECIAYLDPRRIFSGDQTLIPPHELPEDVARAISKIDIKERTIGGTTSTTYKYAFWDKIKAAEFLARYKYRIAEKHEHTGEDGGPIEINDMEVANKLASLVEIWRQREKGDAE